MPLSPQRIRETQFKASRRGYDQAEVDAFVEEVAAALEAAQNEATAMEARARAAVARLQELSQQEGQPSERPAEQVHPTVDESETISRALLLAQRTADVTVAEAQAEADRLIGVGRDEAAKLVDESRAEARRAGEAERVQVEGEVQALLARRDFLESDVDHLEQYVQAQRERITEVVAQLNDMVQRVPGGLADMRRPLLSAAEGEGETEGDVEPGDQDELAEITKVAASGEQDGEQAGEQDGEQAGDDSTPSSAPRLELDEQAERR
jgi:DivIVA domain-containing protein